MNVTELAIQAQKGSDEAFYQLMLSSREQLYRISYAYLLNENEALEAIQQTTYLAYKNIKKLREPKYFKTWLTRILINVCLNEQKRKQRFLPYINQEPYVYEEHNTKLMLKEAIGRLRTDYQHVLILRYYEDYTLSEISDVLQKPEGTIKTWLYQALKQLRKQLKEGEHFG